MDYLVTGSVIVNNLKFPDGRFIENVLGGCVIYSFTGFRVFTRDCAIAAKVGEDFEEYFGDWFDKNQLSREGLVVTHEHTMNSILTYAEDGSFIDRSVWLPEDAVTPMHSDSFSLDLTAFDHLFPQVKKGVYVFNDCQHMAPFREKYGFKVMLEAENNATAEYRPRLMKSLESCDFWSINRKESFEVFGVDSEEAAIKVLLDIGLPCFYRVGKKGSYMVMDGKAWFAPTANIVPPDQEVDPTGCGNSSTAAAMWALCEGYDPLMTACLANAVAGYNVLQYGPIPVMNQRVKSGAMAFAEMLYDEIKDSSRVV